MSCRKSTRATIALVLVIYLLLFAACSQTLAPCPNIIENATATAAATPPPSAAFLSDYSKLKPGQKGQPQWIYTNLQAPWRKYIKVMIVPITFIASTENNFSLDDHTTVVNHSRNQLKNLLSQKTVAVNVPAPDVLRIHVVLMNAGGVTPELLSVSALVPQARMLDM